MSLTPPFNFPFQILFQLSRLTSPSDFSRITCGKEKKKILNSTESALNFFANILVISQLPFQINYIKSQRIHLYPEEVSTARFLSRSKVCQVPTNILFFFVNDFYNENSTEVS